MRYPVFRFRHLDKSTAQQGWLDLAFCMIGAKRYRWVDSKTEFDFVYLYSNFGAETPNCTSGAFRRSRPLIAPMYCFLTVLKRTGSRWVGRNANTLYNYQQWAASTSDCNFRWPYIFINHHALSLWTWPETYSNYRRKYKNSKRKLIKNANWVDRQTLLPSNLWFYHNQSDKDIAFRCPTAEPSPPGLNWLKKRTRSAIFELRNLSGYLSIVLCFTRYPRQYTFLVPGFSPASRFERLFSDPVHRAKMENGMCDVKTALEQVTTGNSSSCDSGSEGPPAPRTRLISLTPTAILASKPTAIAPTDDVRPVSPFLRHVCVLLNLTLHENRVPSLSALMSNTFFKCTP